MRTTALIIVPTSVQLLQIAQPDGRPRFMTVATFRSAPKQKNAGTPICAPASMGPATIRLFWVACSGSHVPGLMFRVA